MSDKKIHIKDLVGEGFYFEKTRKRGRDDGEITEERGDIVERKTQDGVEKKRRKHGFITTKEFNKLSYDKIVNWSDLTDIYRLEWVSAFNDKIAAKLIDEYDNKPAGN